MNPFFSFVTGILTTVLSFLGLVQQQPSIPTQLPQEQLPVAQQNVHTSGSVPTQQGAVTPVKDQSIDQKTQQTKTMPQTNTAPTKVPVSVKPSATIDKSSLSVTTGGKDSSAVSLAGSASNTRVVDVSVTGLGGNLYDSGPISVKGGRWSTDVFYPGGLVTGTYQVTVSDKNKNILITSPLTITGESASTNAAIDEQSLAAKSGTVHISGTGAPEGQWFSIELQDSSRVYVGNMQVVNGKWSVKLYSVLPGTYTVSVQSGPTVLTTGTLVVSD